MRVAAGGRTSEFAPIGEPAAYSADALRALGADVAPVPGGFRAVLLDDTLRFWTDSPFFTSHGAVAQLAHPVRSEGGDYRVPAQFFMEWLPSAFRGRLTLADGVLTNTDANAAPRVTTPAPSRRPAAAAAKSPRIVILDPGHGGPDPGKIGPNGIREKDAVLRLARAVERDLKARGYEVHLTRTADTLIALDDRPHMANQWKNGRPSAVFVSLHFNSYAQRSVRGFETFFLSQARTEDERRVAEMENAAAAFEDGPAPGMPVEEAILNGLRNDFYVRASSDLADEVQRSIRRVHDGPDRGVKRAGFRVLVGALMPAVLIEAAFISNPTEARAIGTSAFREDIASSVADAIDRFFTAHEHLWAAGGS
jgi:N-acetylmuramoyl-L-alanine amidase